MEMKDVMWMCGVFVLLFYGAWSQDTGSNPNVTSPAAFKVDVVKHLAFNLGSGVDLMSSNMTWSETLYVIWTLRLKSKECKISSSNETQSSDSCNDGKELKNKPQLYLHIPNITADDEGVYMCEWAYRGGVVFYEINVTVIVPPSLSFWLEHKGNMKVAVCKAEGGKPAANISWTPPENSSYVKTLHDSNGLFTVESRLELLEGMAAENLSCAVSHPFWKHEQNLTLELKEVTGGQVPWRCILIVVVISVVLVGFLLFALKKTMLRRCQPSDPSPSKPPSKSPPTEDVEEVEPYASYVQRVNSIYNSSADLFT